jgi:hypothetical protein
MAGAAARRGHGRDGPVDAPMEMGNTLDAQVAVDRFPHGSVRTLMDLSPLPWRKDLRTPVV